ncbi:MAG: hypothetical protein U5K69_25150 [Balneolaceae bacterium]|nr:hypothetical protein [Balneolaceae bacterium]
MGFSNLLSKNKGIRLIGLVLLIQITLVSSHQGEFWPFSIYPMFSQAGKPWSKAIVRDVTELPDSTIRASAGSNSILSLPGGAVILDEFEINQNDLSNFIRKTVTWDSESITTLRHIIGTQHLESRRWLIYLVKGQLEGNSVAIRMDPFVLLEQDTTIFYHELHPNQPGP